MTAAFALDFAVAETLSCPCCGKELDTPASLARGVGPDCTRNYGARDAARVDLDAADRAVARTSADRIDWESDPAEILAALCRYLVRYARPEEVGHLLVAIGALGYTRLVSRMLGRGGIGRRVTVTIEGGEYYVTAPYDDRFAGELRRAGAMGRWRPEARAWAVPAGRRAALWAALRAVYAGALVVSARGVSVVA